MPRKAQDAVAGDTAKEPILYGGGLGPAHDTVSWVTDRLDALQARIDEVEERFHETLANLELALVDGYFAKVWPDADTRQWVAECPTVGACVQEATRDEALKAIRAMVPEMLAALQDWGEPVPPKDV